MPRSWDDRADEFEARPLRTAFKWLLGVALLLLLVMAILTPFNAGFAWLQEGARIAGPDNSREQTTAVLDDEKGMVAQAGNVCDIDRAGNTASPNDPQIVGGSPRFQYAALYRRLKADYDRRMANFFEANVTRSLPIPSALGGLPKEAPPLEQRLRDLCPKK